MPHEPRQHQTLLRGPPATEVLFVKHSGITLLTRYGHSCCLHAGHQGHIMNIRTWWVHKIEAKAPVTTNELTQLCQACRGPTLRTSVRPARTAAASSLSMLSMSLLEVESGNRYPSTLLKPQSIPSAEAVWQAETTRAPQAVIFIGLCKVF